MDTSKRHNEYIHTPPFSIGEDQRKAVEEFEYMHKWLGQGLFFFTAQGDMVTCQHPSFDEYLKRAHVENLQAFDQLEKNGFFA